MSGLDWNDYFDNDREAGGDVADDGLERLDDAIIRLANNGLTAEQIADDLDTGTSYVKLIIKCKRGE